MDLNYMDYVDMVQDFNVEDDVFYYIDDINFLEDIDLMGKNYEEHIIILNIIVYNIFDFNYRIISKNYFDIWEMIDEVL